MEDDELITTHFTRSKTDTRFPTGLITELPSGVKRTFPCLYTVPQRFENYRVERGVSIGGNQRR